jgi:single-stranded-DNA-specific exonuclease
MPDPALLADAVPACRRMLRAVERGETILVHGDYDVDGIAAAALLTRTLRALGGRVVPFVPHRLRDGYDFGFAGLEAARAAGATLLVTADSGTRAHGAVEEARQSSIDVIVTDHHTPDRTLPRAFALVNPRREDCSYPNQDLSGTGVVFELARLLGRMTGSPAIGALPHVELVALATIADLVPLSHHNRVLVRRGLDALPETENAGLRALMQVARVRGPVTPGQIGFTLAPRINAAGRVGEARLALDLLLTDDRGEAARLARALESYNAERKQTEARVLEEALARLAPSYDPGRHYGLVLASRDWHPGVIGIVASRLVDRLHRPTILVSVNGDAARGSARSIPGFDILAAITRGRRHLDRFGGHRQAAGMSLARERLDAFRASFNEAAEQELADRDLCPRLVADARIRLDEVTEPLVRYLRHMGPHGIGNPRPLFLARGVTVDGPVKVLKGAHLKMRLRDRTAALNAIGFGLAGRVEPTTLVPGPVDAVFRLKLDNYRGVPLIQAELKAIGPRRSGAAVPASAPAESPP